MFKADSLLKKAELFHKLATYGDRKSFLNSLAQDLSQGTLTFPNEVIDTALGSAAGAANNLAIMLGQRPQSSQQQMDAKNLSSTLTGFRGASIVSSKQELDAKVAPIKTALTQLMNLSTTVSNVADMEDATKQMAQQAKAECERALQLIDNFYKTNNVQDLQADMPAGTAPVQTQEKATQVQSQSQMAKNLAKAVVNKLNTLVEGPKRQEQLKDLDKNISTLKAVWTTLKNKKTPDLQEYFTRMEIAEAIKKVYNSLDYNDLETVKSLDFGHGVPEME